MLPQSGLEPRGAVYAGAVTGVLCRATAASRMCCQTDLHNGCVEPHRRYRRIRASPRSQEQARSDRHAVVSRGRHPRCAGGDLGHVPVPIGAERHVEHAGNRDGQADLTPTPAGPELTHASGDARRCSLWSSHRNTGDKGKFRLRSMRHRQGGLAHSVQPSMTRARAGRSSRMRPFREVAPPFRRSRAAPARHYLLDPMRRVTASSVWREPPW